MNRVRKIVYSISHGFVKLDVERVNKSAMLNTNADHTVTLSKSKALDQRR